MADENELRELSERIARLSRRDLVRVLDMALDVEDRWRDEERARNRAADAALLERERRQREAAQTELLQQIENLREFERQQESADHPRAKREAG
jgi:hypothetical protein